MQSMAASLMFENRNSHRCSFPPEEKQSATRKSYYKFYQLELRQLLTERLHHEQVTKPPKQKHSKTQFNNQRFHKEYIDRIYEKTKIQSRNLDNDKRSSSVLSINNHGTKDPVIFTVTSKNICTASTTESRPKCILKTKQLSPPTRHPGAVNTPTTIQKSIPPKTPTKLPPIRINDSVNGLSKSNARRYTQISSSSQNHVDENHKYARHSTLKTIMSHLNLYPSADSTKWNLYRDFDSKFSASISPDVYRDFERIIL